MAEDILSVLKETRVFPPPAPFAQAAHIKSLDEYRALYRRSVEDPEGFWAEQAETLKWSRKWDKVLEWKAPFAKWFVGGTLNLSENCLDRHVASWRRNKAALIWEGEPGDVRTLTYQQLLLEVCRFANVLKGLGVQKGDRVGLYMPMIPELPIAMLACARIGAPHSVVFGGFSAEAVRDRMNDAEAKVIVTADGGNRRGAVVPLKANVDASLEGTPSVQAVVVVRRTGHEVPMKAGRDHWWHELMAKASPECPPEPLDSEHPLFILYTSGTTGKPKGVVHTTGGYLTQVALTTKLVFDLKDDGDAAVLRRGARCRGQGRQVRSPRRGRLSRHQAAVALDAADGLQRSRALRPAVLVAVPRDLLHGGRGPPRRRRLLLDHGPHRRRGERRRAPSGHHGGRERARVPRQGGGGGGGGTPRRAEGPIPGRLRHPAGGPGRRGTRGRGSDARRAEGARGPGDRGDRAARRDPFHGRAAQDPQREDHAPAPPRHRRGQGDGGRHHDPRGLLGPGEAPRGRGAAGG